MKTIRFDFTIVVMFLLSFVSSAHAEATDEGDEISSGKCTDLQQSDIPVGQFMGNHYSLPVDQVRETQDYNTPHEDGFKLKGTWLWQHDGWDVVNNTNKDKIPGVDNVYATMVGLVVVSEKNGGATSGWGESIMIATRTNQYSEQIITHHYHHMHRADDGSYTTRRKSKCDLVGVGDVIGKVGKTGTGTNTHLHLGIRIWQNIGELNDALDAGGSALYGHGYGQGDEKRLARNRDPEGLLYEYFHDFHPMDGESPAYMWAWPYVYYMRANGFEFGKWDGRYGAQEGAKRSDVARWIKIAAKRNSVFPAVATFDDVPLDHDDSPYIEALLSYPKAGASVLNPMNNCTGSGKNFCPDNLALRPEVLKMVIMAFYADEFFQIYDKDIWKNSYIAAMSLLTQFQDVSPFEWYAPYVYFGVQKGLVANQAYFHPEAVAMNEEIAKWIIVGYDHKNGLAGTVCSNMVCAAGQYCNPQTSQCENLSQCIPSETQECEVGGGYDPCMDAVCQPGQTQTQTCGGGGQQQRTCNNECQWDAWMPCEYSGCQNGQTLACGNCGTATCAGGQWGVCQNQGVCTPGQVETSACSGGGQQQRTCSGACSWGAWNDCPIQQDCTPGQTQSCGNCGTMTCDGSGNWGACLNEGVCAPGATQDQSCSGNGTQSRTCQGSCTWGSWSVCSGGCECSSGVCCDGCNYRDAGYACDTTYVYQCEGSSAGQDAEKAMVRTYCSGFDSGCNGSQTQYGWQTNEDCSMSQVCEMNGGVSECVADQSCTDTYTANMSQSCFFNSQSAGSPTLCLNVTKISGSQFKYSLCKQGSAFQNEFTYQLVDDNNMVQFTEYTGTAGTTCTPEKTFSVSYIPGYGPGNGAGLRALVTSPSGCNQSTCQYNTGGITITEACL